MKTINFNQSVYDHRGGEINDFHISVADTLVTATKGDSSKFVSWAVKIVNGEPLDLDESDFKKLREFFENHDRLTHLARVRILDILDQA